MSAPWSEKDEKTTVDGADEFMLIDSTDATPATTNKRVTLNTLYTSPTRFQNFQGSNSNVGSLTDNTLTLPSEGNVFELFDSGNVSFITTTGWQLGSIITLVFNGDNVTLTNRDNTGTPTNTEGFFMREGNVNLVVTFDDDETITFVYSSKGTGNEAWREVCRSSNT